MNLGTIYGQEYPLIYIRQVPKSSPFSSCPRNVLNICVLGPSAQHAWHTKVSVLGSFELGRGGCSAFLKEFTSVRTHTEYNLANLGVEKLRNI